MSNQNAIATVTRALRNRLADVLPDAVAGATATMVRPGETGGTAGLPAVGANVFLYATRVNGAFRNIDLPTRTADGAVLTRPVAAVDLDYLFSFYGADLPSAQQLLGATLRSFHARPTLTTAMIAAVELPSPLSSNLADQSDPVRIVPLDLSIEEMSKLWSVLFQTRYVLSTAYRLGPVLIEAMLDLVPQPPVRRFVVVAVAQRPPVVTGVQAAGGGAIVPLGRIAALGQFDLEQQIAVSVNGTEALLLLRRPDRLELDLPATASIGPNGLAVRYDVLLGAPPVPHRGVGSGLVAFVVVPEIAPGGVTVDNVTGSGSAPRDARLQTRLTTPVDPGRQLTLLLADPATQEMRLFLAAPLAAAGDLLEFAVTAIPAGTYAAQVAVDGALSPTVPGVVIP